MSGEWLNSISYRVTFAVAFVVAISVANNLYDVVREVKRIADAQEIIAGVKHE